MLQTWETRFEASYQFNPYGSPQVPRAGSITHAGPNVKQRSAGEAFLTLAEARKRRAPRAPGTSFAPLFPANGNSGGTWAGRARRVRTPQAQRGTASGTLPGQAGARQSRRFLAEGKRAPGSRLLWDVGLPGAPGSLPANYCTVSLLAGSTRLCPESQP